MTIMRPITCFLLFSFIAFAACFYEVDIMKELINEKPNSNVIISPISIFQAVSLVSNGAVADTKFQLLGVIDQSNVFNANKKNEILMTMLEHSKSTAVANAVLTKFAPNEDFIQKAKQYQAYVDTLRSAGQVNKWCSEKTKGKISHIVDEIKDDVKMILLNAVYFKGEWKTKFKAADTMPGVFHSVKGDQKVKMMHMTLNANYYESSTVKIIELPYEDDVSALIILPSEDINGYIKEMNQMNLNLSTQKLEIKKVKLALPKFELDFSASLVNTFKKLDATAPFDPAKADFSNITQHMKLFIGDIIHKTYLKFDDKGTEAAAVTAIEIMATSMPLHEDKAEMTVDKPFIVFIQHKKVKIADLFFSKIASIN